MKPNLEMLLQHAAKAKTAELPLDEILTKIHHQSVASAKPRLKIWVLAAGGAVFVLLFCLLSIRSVVVEGKTYLAFFNEVHIDDSCYSLDAGSRAGNSLVRLLDSNQYALISNQESIPQVVVFGPDASQPPLRNPDFVSQTSSNPVSLAARAMFPVIGDLMVRTGPDISCEALATLYSGQQVTQIGRVGNWAILEWDGGVAYAYAAYLYPVPDRQDQAVSLVFHALEEVNVRSLPTSREGSQVLGVLSAGQEVLCTGRIGEWTQVCYQDSTAYVFARYLERSAP